MMKVYSICSKRISFNSPRLPSDWEEWQEFECKEGKPDIEITAFIEDDIPSVPANSVTTAKGVQAGVLDGKVYRHTPMGTVKGALSIYDPAVPYKSECFFTKESFNVMTDIRYFWSSIALSQLLLYNNALFFHASYVEYEGKGIIFSAPCGTGKSTQAELWRKHKGATVINGDKAGVLVENSRATVYGVPFSGTSGICINKSMPLRAVVFLAQSKENTLVRLTGAQAVGEILNNVYLDFAAPEEMQRCVDVAIELLKSVPVYRLSCTPDERAVEALYEVL